MVYDAYGRSIDYLRISVTDRCNLRCFYCMPSDGVKPVRYRDILSYEEIVRIVRVAVPLGIRKIRITGGEPLRRKNLSSLVASLRGVEGIENISLTTNGVLLQKHAGALAAAGLHRVNVSLDSLDSGRYAEITGGGSLELVQRGIVEAEKAGLKPVKINMVPVRGFNDTEIEDFAKITLEKPYQVRFIEFMPVGTGELWSPDRCVPIDEVRSIVERVGSLSPVKVRRSGPARHFRFDGAPGVVGFINAVTHQFCSECSRLRLTADGKLRPCLFSETEIDLKTSLRSGASDAELTRLVNIAIEAKPEGHTIGCSDGSRYPDMKPMSKIGG